jgi:hypothetical protein
MYALPDDPEVKPVRGRPRLPDSEYRAIAREYFGIVAEQNGRTRGAIQKLAEQRGVEYSTARGWIARCRKYKFLVKRGRDIWLGPKTTNHKEENDAR